MKAAIHQPNFLPWIGYFNKIALVDVFVFFDDVQLPRGKSYVTRTKISLDNNEHWLTIPVLKKAEMSLIKDVKVNNSINWKRKILRTLELYYGKAPAFDEFYPIIEEIIRRRSDFLVDYNIPLIQAISRKLELKTKFITSSKIPSSYNYRGVERIIEINKYLDADTYISGSGKGSRRYLIVDKFKKRNITLEWQEFTPFVYQQHNITNFTPNLSIIDLIFNEGFCSSRLLKMH